MVGTVVVATTSGMSPLATIFAAPADTIPERRDARITAIVSGTSLGVARPGGPATPNAIVFYPDGTVRLLSALSTLGATVYVQDTNGQHPYRVAIFGSTGFARVLSH